MRPMCSNGGVRRARLCSLTNGPLLLRAGNLQLPCGIHRSPLLSLRRSTTLPAAYVALGVFWEFRDRCEVVGTRISLFRRSGTVGQQRSASVP